MAAYPLTTLATIAALIVYVTVLMLAGRARGAYGVPAPAVSGNVEFEKRYRVQMNTLEQLVLFVPALWLAAPVLGDRLAAGIGAIWSIGRILYAVTYVRDPKTRSLGFGLTFLPSLILLVAALKFALTTVFAGVTTLVSARLTLAPHTIADFADCAAMWGDPAVVRFIGGRPHTEEESWARLLRYAGLWSLLGFGYWAVRETASGRYVGDIGFADFHRDVTPSLSDAPEAGWALAAWAHGQGYASEGLRAALDWADKVFGAPRTVCLIDPSNVASIKLAAKVGFRAFADSTYKDHPTRLFERAAGI